MPKSKSVRKLQLMEANAEEDRSIRRLEKCLKLKKKAKKKSDNGVKKIHNMFKEDGLDYILGILDKGENTLDFGTSDEDNEEKNSVSKSKQKKRKYSATSEDETQDLLDSDGDEEAEESNHDDEEDGSNDEEVDDGEKGDSDEECPLDEASGNELKTIKPKIWEDIYGRFRDEKGDVIQNPDSNSGVYIPPAKRLKSEASDQHKAVILKLQRQLKGLLNRLSESNMQPICSQIEQIYMKSSRNDMNESLMLLISELVLSPVLTPPRLIMEQAMIVSLLHANVGSEIGAYFLQCLAIKIKELRQLKQDCWPGKQINNLLIFLSHLYDFKVTGSLLIFDVLEILIESFRDKDIELIQVILKNVGFNLRKDNPLKLKEVVNSIQKKAPTFQSSEDSSRVQFMLDTLTAIRNNNIYKVPDHDSSIMDRAKKVLRTMVRPGCSMQELSISFEDLLNAEEKGRWWIVGSAWSARDNTGDQGTTSESAVQPAPNSFSDTILELARKQHMNTEIRKTIFCVIMTAEDYMDCFEKLLRLNLKNQQEREIINVLLHCVLNEKKFNPYYSFLAGKFCKFARKYCMNLQFALWDKFKVIEKLKSHQIDNLAHFLRLLFLKDDMCISILKVIHFSEMNKTMIRFFRQILQSILLHDSEETCRNVFRRIAPAKNLHLLKEGLRLFMHHFLLRKSAKFEPEVFEKLQERVKIVENILSAGVKL